MIKLILGFMVCVSININAQQINDTNFKPKNSLRTFSKTESPVVLLDEAHNNFHTMDGRYQPFVKILENNALFFFTK